MNRSVCCYPQPGKAKSLRVLEAFAQGCGGDVMHAHARHLESRDAAFYGCVGIEHLLHEAQQRGGWWYGDNAFLDRSRETFFRFSQNEFQISRLATPDHARLKALDVVVKPWRKDGRHIVVAEQSEHFLTLSGAHKDWLAHTTEWLGYYTDRPLRIRKWMSNKGKASASLAQDLNGAWALVTHMSAAAVEAVIAGIPVYVTGRCAASPMASGALSDLYRPLYPDNRIEWLAGLAGRQWTLDEYRDGTAWRTLGSEH